MGLRTGWQMALLAGLLLGSSCAHSPQAVEQEESDPTFRIGREDVLDIAVWRDPDLSRTVPVRPDGMISLPLLGDVQAEGNTPDELASKLRQGLAPYIQDPRVSVIVREVNSTRVYVTGEVAQPGAYALRGRMSLVQAIALAGGFSDFADREGIRIIRPDDQGEGKIMRVRYSDLLRDDAERRGLHLRPGDTVVVP